MSAEDPTTLVRRVTDLETEVRALRRRVSALEGVEFVEPAGAPGAPVPVAPLASVPAPKPVDTLPPADTPRPPSMPPPIPVSALVSPAVTSVPVAKPAAAAFGSPQIPAPAVRAPQPEEPSALRELLDALHLLPPSGQRSGEAQIGAWWATRIGALLAVISVVFFGVYVSLNTPPWVKLLELAAIAGGVTLAGLWIERRIERLGSVIIGSGLALCFFTAFAAYAVPAVKVIDSITAGALLQALAVVAIGGVALWRRSPIVATMAVALGFVSAFFSLAEGFDDFAVVAGLGLAAMAVFFRHREGWVAPVLTSATLVHVLNAFVALEVWGTAAGQRGWVVAFMVVGAGFGVHLLSVILEGGGEDGRIAFAQRWIQAINTSLAVLAGLIVALLVLLPEDRLSWYFFAAGGVLIGAAAWAWRVVPRDGIFSMWAVKASSLIALGVITEWDARTRWIALLVQAVVLVAAAGRTGKVSLAATGILAWLVSLLFFGEDIGALRGNLVSADGVAVALYVLGGAALLAWAGRWLKQQERMKEAGAAMGWILGVGAALPVGMTIGVLWLEPWAMLACVGVSVALILIARAFRSVVPVIGSVAAMLAAHVIVQVFDERLWGLGWLWIGATLIAVRSMFLAWLIGVRSDERREAWSAASTLLLVLAVASLGGATMQSIASYPALAITVVITTALVALGARLDREDLSLAGMLGLPAALALHLWHRPDFFLETGGAAWLWLAAAGVPIALAIAGGARLSGRAAGVARGLAAATGVILAWRAADQNFGSLGLAWSVLGAAGVYAAIGRWRSCAVAQVAASLLLALATFHFLGRTSWSVGYDAWAVLIAVFAILMALAAAPLVQARGAGWLSPGPERAWRIMHAVLAVGALLLIATRSNAVWQAQGSVVWALGGVVLFVLGLTLRTRSHRVAGLITLGLCIPRVFIYDIQSTSHRIAAFAVLGVLLLVVGFSYQKFRHLIEGGPEGGRKDEEQNREDSR